MPSGCKRTRLGHRLDLKFQKRTTPEHKMVNLKGKKLSLPSKVDLSHLTGPIRNQGQAGSCVSFSMTSAAHYLLKKEGHENPLLSPLFMYWTTRVKEENESATEDNGSTLQEGIQALTDYGVCLEKLCKYDDSKISVTPSSEAFQDALSRKLIQYSPVSQNLESIKGCLAAGFVVNVGVAVYPSFQSDKVLKSGKVPMPSKSELKQGTNSGHAIFLNAYNDSTKRFTFQNSWGNVGMDHSGLFTIPYEYITNKDLTSEIFVLTQFG